MGDDIIPLTSRQWNDLWEIKQDLHQADHDAAFWNERAKSFTNKDAPGSYTDCFLKLASIATGESVFDMGCGTGNLSIPLAETGHKVLAADFSSVMLERLTERAHVEGLNNISTKEISWEDDWEHAGIAPKSYDVCLASRSIATHDLRAALLKLTAVAKRAVCITLTCDSSPRIDDRALREIEQRYVLALMMSMRSRSFKARGISPRSTTSKRSALTCSTVLTKHLRSTPPCWMPRSHKRA